jgi:hypothetical protein
MENVLKGGLFYYVDVSLLCSNNVRIIGRYKRFGGT